MIFRMILSYLYTPNTSATSFALMPIVRMLERLGCELYSALAACNAARLDVIHRQIEFHFLARVESR